MFAVFCGAKGSGSLLFSGTVYANFQLHVSGEWVFEELLVSLKFVIVLKGYEWSNTRVWSWANDWKE